jgi:hypothetical protein
MKEEWETKRISKLEYVLAMPKRGDAFIERPMDKIVEGWRDWLLGGENYDWRIEEDLANDELILMRR